MPAIKRIRARPYDIPLKGTLKWGKGHELPRLQHVLIEVELSDGARGIAESTPRPSIYGETQASVMAIVDQHLAPMVLGKAVDTVVDIDDISAKLELIKGNNTAKGALNMALHHALAQSQGMNLADFLDITQARTQVSYIVSTGDMDAVLDDVSGVYAAGVRVFKVKIGKAISQEIATIERLQGAFADAEFYVDANQCLTLENAAEVLNQLVERGVIHCEEALPVQMIEARQRLRQQTRMPIIADDSAFTVADLERELAFDTFDILNIKTARTGYSQSRLMLKQALECKKSVMIGSQASSLLGCLYTALFAGYAGVDCATECSFYLLTDVDLSDALPIVAGWLDLSAVQNALTRFHATLF